MKEFELTLCSYKTDALWVSVWAEMNESALKINGQDLGNRVRGNDEYEYSYIFNKTITMQLLDLIGGT